ncbi:MAG: GPW/gp25 family protein [Symploca sp. SIO2C1]|nr:GPW/gp25 family protein [Symploca sp. SIO2C1]
MTNAEIQASIEAVLADSTKTPLHSLLGLSSINYQIEAERMVRDAIARYEPGAEVVAVEFNGGLEVLWQPVTTNFRSDTYPDYSALPPQEAADKLLEYALAQYLGKVGGNPAGAIEEIRRVVESDARLKVSDVAEDSDGYKVEIISSALVEKILRYDNISQYDGTWSYK